jgi:serine/threonine protein kinase
MLLRRLAVGGMAEVYVAKTKGIGGFEKLVAIKVIHPRFSEDEHFVQMLVEEAKISVQLNHVNIAQTFDLGCIDETYYIAMEYIEGADAFRVEKRSREKKVALPLDICAYIAAEVLHGLSYAHRKHGADGKPLGIVHRDISPQNVLISHAGEVKLVDFGIAKAAVRSGQTEVGVIKGKYYYMSPEQAWGDPVDQRTDVFATGLLLHELLTGQMVYQEENVPALLDRVRKADIPSPRLKRKDVPEALEVILAKALEKEANDRYASAHAFAQELTKFIYQANPSFTAQRLVQLMAVLFPEEARRHSEALAQSSDQQDIVSMSREEFAPSAEDSKILDLNAARRALTQEAKPQAPAPAKAAPLGRDRPTKELRSPTRRPAQREDDTTSEHARQDEWEESTVLKDDEESWDESTLIEKDGGTMAEVNRLLKARRAAQSVPKMAPVVGDEDITHDVSGELQGEKTVAMGFGDAVAALASSKPDPIPARLPSRPDVAPLLGSSVEELPPDSGQIFTGAPELAPERTVAFGHGAPAAAPPTELTPERTVAFTPGPLPVGPAAAMPATPRVSASPSAGGVRLGPDAERFFGPPPPGSAMGASGPMPPPSPLEPSSHSLLQPSPGYAPAHATPAGYDPFIAQPPPPVVSTEALGKPRPLRWILSALVVLLVLAVTITTIALVALRSEPATLQIITVPDGASIQIDGLVLEQRTPTTIPNLEADRSYHVKLMRRGHEPHETDIVVTDGPNREVFMLEAIRVTLHVETVPPGAQVWVDNQVRGSAPLDITQLNAGQIVMIRASAPGHETVHRQVTLSESERNASLVLELRPSN